MSDNLGDGATDNVEPPWGEQEDEILIKTVHTLSKSQEMPAVLETMSFQLGRPADRIQARLDHLTVNRPKWVTLAQAEADAE